MNDLSVSKSCFLYQSFYFVLWFEFIKTVLSSSKRQEGGKKSMSLVKPISRERRIISGFLESSHFLQRLVETAHTVAVQQNLNHLRLADKTALSA